ncbi:glycosyltransferase [Bacteroides heparinolyticus]|uniref:Glycosyltransferase n=1 Tax=Prevotella heparinolytica TaxID=28113 RepID=A0A3P2A1M3_9BACE|nr:glycosyltransferase family 4 protein [Bacteroides heparinolyticus]RRD89321.1 glycosyltransferase [Bacteroides heparinolyticus]
MNDVSIAIPSTYYKASKYEPMLKRLGGRLSRAYGIGYPRNYVFTDEPKNKMVLFKWPVYIGQKIVKPLCEFFSLPSYYAYIVNCVLCDWIISKKISKDKARVLYTSPFMVRTIKVAKKRGMVVILEAGNSEPKRENARISNDYVYFNIKKQYIYGRTWFMNSCCKGFSLCDGIISISNVSLNTFLEAGFPKGKTHLIPLTGTDFKIANFEDVFEKKKAFISTAYHSFIKGTHRLLLAWKKAQITDVPLFIVGPLCEDMKEFVNKYGPFDNVVFLGHQSDLGNFYSTRDAVGVLLSLSEGAVRVTPEMMSYGFPMIVSPDATCDLIENGKNGFVVNPLNEDEIVEKLNFFAEDWNRVHQLRKTVIDSVKYRTTKDWANEVADYLITKC